MAWLWLVGAFGVAVLGYCWLLPSPSGRPSARAWVAAGLQRCADRLRGDRRRRPDPFEVLRLQTRLSVLAGQIRSLEGDEWVYAKAHRLEAHRAAYDDLLDEACRLAGVPVEPGQGRGERRRWHEELELASRGWSW